MLSVGVGGGRKHLEKRWEESRHRRGPERNRVHRDLSSHLLVEQGGGQQSLHVVGYTARLEP